MSEIKEISRRVMDNSDCDPNSISFMGAPLAYDAEIVVEDKGEKIYLHAQWVSEVPEDVIFEATKESIYDVYEKLNNAGSDEFDDLINERDRIESEKLDRTYVWERYARQMSDLIDMLMEAGAEIEVEEDDDDEDEEEEEFLW